jgi:hypothetical protein
MSNKIDHYIMTSMNMGLYSTTPKSYLATKEAKDAYMVGRFPIVEKCLISSLKYQTNKNFKPIWIVDDVTPNEFVYEYENLAKEVDATIIFDKWLLEGVSIRGGTCCSGTWVDKFKEMIESKVVAITRYDNDDILSKNFVDVVQQHFNEDPYPYCIDFWKRISIDPKNPKDIYLVQSIKNGTSRCSPTVTLVEEKKDCKTPLYAAHFKLGKIFSVKIYKDVVWCKTERINMDLVISKFKRYSLDNITGFEGIGF